MLVTQHEWGLHLTQRNWPNWTNATEWHLRPLSLSVSPRLKAYVVEADLRHITSRPWHLCNDCVFYLIWRVTWRFNVCVILRHLVPYWSEYFLKCSRCLVRTTPKTRLHLHLRKVHDHTSNPQMCVSAVLYGYLRKIQIINMRSSNATKSLAVRAKSLMSPATTIPLFCSELCRERGRLFGVIWCLLLQR